ncbi:MAG: protein kinase [Tepidisphaera sp.]|nr:protein kinase [Tepidisphaera sp.]
MGETKTVTLTRDLTLTSTGGGGEALPQVEIPKQLGAVELVREIGKGGMGVVWLGRDNLLGRDVAVKFLLHAVASEDDPDFAQFLEGARAAAALRHKGLNTVLHADVISGVPFIVMEYVDGPTLGQVLQRTGALTLAATRVVMNAACEAVGVLHDAGIVHRDIKPANILLGQDGSIVLTDFGLACPRPRLSMGSRVEAVAGTPTYMAPEMFDKNVSARSDVYALGITMYELLIGTAPFEGTLEEVREAHRSTPVPVENLEPFEPSLAEVVGRATNKNPMFRLKTGSSMLVALEEAFAKCNPMVSNKARGESELAALTQRTLGRAGLVDGGSKATPQVTYYDRLNTLVQKRKESDGGEGIDLVERVLEEAKCWRCSSPLKGEPLTGRCPGCLLLVREAMRARSGGDAATTPVPTPGATPSSEPAAARVNEPPAKPGPNTTTAPATTPAGKGLRSKLRAAWRNFLGG